MVKDLSRIQEVKSWNGVFLDRQVKTIDDEYISYSSSQLFEFLFYLLPKIWIYISFINDIFLN